MQAGRDVFMRQRNAILLRSVIVIFSLGSLVSVSGLAKEPPKASGKRAAIAAGKKIYDTTCGSCHPRGGAAINPKKTVAGSPILASKAALRSFLEKHSSPMPTYVEIARNDTDLSNLYEYAKTFNKPVQLPDVVKGTPEFAGKKIYDNSCGSCHPGGGAAINPKKTIAGSTILTSKAALKAYLEKHSSPMPTFSTIARSETDLQHLYAYIKMFAKPAP